MKILNRLLLSLPAQGFLWIIFLFAFCFLCVHLLKLAKLGTDTLRKTPTPAPEKKEEKKTPAEQPQEPVYYIVEKKTRRPKSSYSEPKQIKFK